MKELDEELYEKLVMQNARQISSNIKPTAFFVVTRNLKALGASDKLIEQTKDGLNEVIYECLKDSMRELFHDKLYK